MSATLAPTLGVDRPDRLRRLVEHGKTLEAEGLPFPTDQIRTAVESSLAEGNREQAEKILVRAETLLASATRDWTWVRGLLQREDELRELALRLGIDLEHLDARVGNARAQLKGAPLSQGSLQKAAASASAGLAVLNDTIPKFCVQEGQKLGVSIRVARNRGEDVSGATQAFARFLKAVQDEQMVETARLLLEVRKTVARIPRAPTAAGYPAPAPAGSEEEEILLEARKLARRLHRIKGKAHDAQSAARLMTQVRAALSEERRYGTPEEEIEALWNEVDRLTKERNPANKGAKPGVPGDLSPASRAPPTPSPVASTVPAPPRVVPPPGAVGDLSPEDPTVPPGASGDLDSDADDADEDEEDDPQRDLLGPSPLVPPDDGLPTSSRGRSRRPGRP
ncbi:MAG: hypothetical protein L3K01_06855 [Thermoplasmata archaeon]|nr:hypothetical protein [Thermoplasmata archaeon]MCI4333422.1 hypothetical protein [Thermoplasmata archaeon]